MNSSFSELFKKYRLRSQFESLSEFGEAMAENGLIYEDSIYSHWQKGTRTPKDRKVLLEMVKIFASREGISTLKEAHSLFEAAGQGYLTEAEIEELPSSLHISPVFQAPREIAYYTGREDLVKEIQNKLKNAQPVLLYGAAGSGKTALAIKMAHILRHEYPDGVLWIRLDTSSIVTVLTHIAETFGKNIKQMNDVYTMSSYVRSLLDRKKVLLIYDNAEADTNMDLLIPNTNTNGVIITSQIKEFSELSAQNCIHVDTFTLQESVALFETVHGKDYVQLHLEIIKEVCNLVGNLPLGVKLMAVKLQQPYSDINQLVLEIKKEQLEISALKYADKDLGAAIMVSYKKLSPQLQNVFTSLQIFNSPDFMLEAVAFVNNLNLSEARSVLNSLVHRSLVEFSSQNRYRIHPLVKLFIQKYPLSQIYYQRAVTFYTQILKKESHKSNFYEFILLEMDTIISVIKKCIKLKLHKTKEVETLWVEFHLLMSYAGYRAEILQYTKEVYAIRTLQHTDRIKIYCCIGFGVLYTWKGELNTAEKFLKIALENATIINDEELIAETHLNLGRVYRAQDKITESITHLKKSLDIYDVHSLFLGVERACRHLAEAYLLHNNLTDAQVYLEKSLKSTKHITYKAFSNVMLSRIYSSLALIQFLQEQYSKAKTYFEKSEFITKSTNTNHDTSVINHIGLGLLYEMSNKPALAIQMYEKAREEVYYFGADKNIDKTVIIFPILKDFLQKSKLFTVIFS